MKKKKTISKKPITKAASKPKSKPVAKPASATKKNLGVKIGSKFIQPLGDRILVRQTKDDAEKTASGIYIPDSVKKEKPEEGTVIVVGEGRREDGKLVPLTVSVGDTVVFSKYGYDEIKIDGEDYLIVKEDNILAIIK
jgi:chaperonin GroES